MEMTETTPESNGSATTTDVAANDIDERDASQIAYAAEESAFPIDQLFNTILERLEVLKNKIANLEQQVSLKREAHRTATKEAAMFAHSAIGHLRNLDVTVNVISGVADVSPVAQAPAPPKPEPEPEPQPNPEVQQITYPEPGVSVVSSGTGIGGGDAQDAPEFLRRVTQGRKRVQPIAILVLAAGLIAGMITLWPTQTTARSARSYEGDYCQTAHCERIKVRHRSRHRYHDDPPAKKQAAAEINVNPYGDPSWWQPIMIGRIEHAFEAIAERDH
jgi:hypothetical protein